MVNTKLFGIGFIFLMIISVAIAAAAPGNSDVTISGDTTAKPYNAVIPYHAVCGLIKAYNEHNAEKIMTVLFEVWPYRANLAIQTAPC